MYDEQLMQILDQTDDLADQIRHSELFDAYQKTKQALVEDREAQRLYGQFLKSKINYDEVQRFGRYHPDYQEVMLTTRR
ncbi:TPA: YlbF family regulator, partial [Staphylococcus delphini]|nr:YlbF family regulator [Staphylococcus delphini]